MEKRIDMKSSFPFRINSSRMIASCGVKNNSFFKAVSNIFSIFIELF